MLTIGGLTAFDATLTLPRTGAWTLDARVDVAGAEAPSGAVVVDVDEGKLTLNGFVSPRGGAWQETGHLRIVGGAGGLQVTATPRHYNGTTVRTVASDLLRTAGERLSPASDAATLGRSLSAWTTAGVSTGRMLSRLLLTAAPTATWRVLPDGSIWIGAETWPDSGLLEGDDYQILSEDPMRAEAILGVESPVVMPGTLLGGRRVSYVEHRLNSPETRTIVWFEDEGGGAGDDRLRKAVRGMVRGAQQPIDYLSLYTARVVSQSGGTIDVRPDDARIPSMGGVRLYAGLPEWKLSLRPGGSVLIGWSGGDPRAPFAVAFDSDVGVNTVSFGIQALAEAAVRGNTYRAAEDAMLTTISTAFGVAAPVCSAAVDPSTTQAGVIATGVALTAAIAAITAFQAAAATYLSTSVRHS